MYFLFQAFLSEKQEVLVNKRKLFLVSTFNSFIMVCSMEVERTTIFECRPATFVQLMYEPQVQNVFSTFFM